MCVWGTHVLSTEAPAAPLTLSPPPQVPCYSYGQKLSKLAILRIACNYILSLARLADLDYSADHSNLSFSECVQRCTRTLQAEGRAKKRKVRTGVQAAAAGSAEGRNRSLGTPHMPRTSTEPERSVLEFAGGSQLQGFSEPWGPGWDATPVMEFLSHFGQVPGISGAPCHLGGEDFLSLKPFLAL